MKNTNYEMLFLIVKKYVIFYQNSLIS